jgi:hypothetical protein
MGIMYSQLSNSISILEKVSFFTRVHWFLSYQVKQMGVIYTVQLAL